MGVRDDGIKGREGFAARQGTHRQGHSLLEALATASATASAVALATATLTALASAVPLDPCPAAVVVTCVTLVT